MEKSMLFNTDMVKAILDGRTWDEFPEAVAPRPGKHSRDLGFRLAFSLRAVVSIGRGLD